MARRRRASQICRRVYLPASGVRQGVSPQRLGLELKAASTPSKSSASTGPRAPRGASADAEGAFRRASAGAIDFAFVLVPARPLDGAVARRAIAILASAYLCGGEVVLSEVALHAPYQFRALVEAVGKSAGASSPTRR